MLHTNIRSSSRNICRLKSYLQTLNVNFGIIGISENWVTVENIDVQTMPGYSHEYCIRSNGKRWWCEHLCQIKNESIVIEFDKHVFNSKRNVIIGIFYRSPNSSLKLFNEKMEKILNIIEMEKKYAYIMGDFNVNCKKDFCDLTIHSQQFVNMFLSHYYLIKLINIPTRVTKTSENLLDNVYTNDPISGTNGVHHEGTKRPS